MNVYVQFESPDQMTVIAVFGSPQDPSAWINYAEITDDDPRYLLFMQSIGDAGRAV